MHTVAVARAQERTVHPEGSGWFFAGGFVLTVCVACLSAVLTATWAQWLLGATPVALALLILARRRAGRPYSAGAFVAGATLAIFLGALFLSLGGLMFSDT